MKAFATHQRLFKLMCIWPLADDSSLWKKILITVLGVTVVLSEVLGLLASLVFVAKYVTIDLEGSVKTVFQIAAYINTTYVMFIAFSRRQRIIKLIKKFQRIYDASRLWLCRKRTYNKFGLIFERLVIEQIMVNLQWNIY